jgi:hypothetical protein
MFGLRAMFDFRLKLHGGRSARGLSAADCRQRQNQWHWMRHPSREQIQRRIQSHSAADSPRADRPPYSLSLTLTLIAVQSTRPSLYSPLSGSSSSKPSREEGWTVADRSATHFSGKMRSYGFPTVSGTLALRLVAMTLKTPPKFVKLCQIV